MIRKYEVMYIIDQDASDVKGVQKKLNDVLVANGGKILESEEWGLKDFAYEINKKKKGHYFVLIVETQSDNIEEFRRISRIDKSVVRELIINTENEKKYVQSTKLSKTDMSKFKEEKKPSRNFERKPGYRRPEGDTTASEAPQKENVIKSESVKEAIKEVESTPKTAKDVAEKPTKVESAEKKVTKKATAEKKVTKKDS
ncbi:30S ribosomal protein S6 [Spiroplasma tabanidicola]|uniref:Small ribosomal subunit protein bS6 n=1 Tax=Spiroplasma tabanidicola TaxID=324079 RepID=A0A6I6C7I3_9MOLU|nr:30S ribosomal protein S6 [Spiroplasma tabanidicola]QGS51389.1 30S ribosomal protein S6 [Spiroplasma tabanidicola]